MYCYYKTRDNNTKFNSLEHYYYVTEIAKAFKVMANANKHNICLVKLILERYAEQIPYVNDDPTIAYYLYHRDIFVKVYHPILVQMAYEFFYAFDKEKFYTVNLDQNDYSFKILES